MSCFRIAPFSLITALVVAASPNAFAVAEADLLIAYDQTYSSSVGGEANAQVITANTIAGCNDINDRSGTGARLRICGYHQAAQYLYQTTSKGGFVNWMASYDSHMTDVVDAGNARGADLVAWICVSTADGAAAVAQQPGRYSAFDPGQFWSAVVAHELGGHNYGCDHSGGKGDLPGAYPKSVMMHNYCNGGGTSPPYLYSSPNLWLGGVRMQGVGSTCLGGAVNNGDNAYLKSTTCQGVADSYARVIVGPNLGNVVRRWLFNQAAGVAPAGTTVTDSVTGTELVTVQGAGATFTGSGLGIPGGPSGSGAAYLQLPGGVLSAYANVTIEIWAKEISAQNWARLMDFNNGAANYITLTASKGTDLNSQRFESVMGGATVTLDSGIATTAGVLHHYAITYASTGAGAGRWTWYRDGDQVAYLDVAYALASLQDVNNWLGRSAYSGDAFASCEYQEVRISNVAMSRDEVFANYTLGPNRSAAIVTLNADDATGLASLAAAGNWSDGLAPSAGKTYETYRFHLRTPTDGASRTFAGQSLAVDGGGITWKGTSSSTLTVNDLTVAGDCELLNAGSGTWTLAGNLTVKSAEAQVRANNGPVNLTANLSGGGNLLYTINTVTLGGNNTNFTGKTIVGDGRFSSISIDSEARLGANPANFVADQLTLNRGVLDNSGSLTISNANRGLRVGVSAALFNVAPGTTLTLAVPLSSPASGDALLLSPLYPNPVSGMLIKDNTGTLALTHPNNSHAGEVVINAGVLTVDGGGRLNNGDQAMPVVDNATLAFNSTANQTISGVISGNGTLSKQNSGMLTLTAANTLSGAVTVNGGTMYANIANAANNTVFSYVSGITVNNGGTLQSSANGLFGWDGTQEHPITVNTGGLLTGDSGADIGVSTVTLAGGTLANLGASAAYGSWRFDNPGDVLAVTQDSTVSAVNVKFANGGAIDVATTKTLNFAGTITDAGSGGASTVLKSGGAGTLLFSGAQTYTGSTMVNAGRLMLTNSASLASSNIILGGSAVFDVSGLASGFIVGSGQALAGSGTNIGLVSTVSGARIYAGTDGGFGTNQFATNLTMVAGAFLCFDLGPSATGSNDKFVVGGNLNLNNTAIRIKGPSNLDPAADYLLATVSGTLSGTVNPTPIWDVPPGNAGAFTAMVTNGNQIVLHAVSLPPAFTQAVASPASLGRNQWLLLSAAGVPGTYPVSNCTANVTSIGGPSALTLMGDGGGNFTNSLSVSAATAIGAGKLISLTITDSNGISSVTNITLTIVATNRNWNGGSASDNNWGSNPNWNTGAAPGFAGDGVVFGGGARLSPVMETNYSVTGVTFDNTAGSFTVGAPGRFLTLTGAGVTNNSAASQTLNVPLSLGAAQTFSAAAGNLTLGQNLTNNGNLVTVSGASNTVVSGTISGSAGLLKAGNGMLTLAGTSSYSGTATVSAGQLNVTGTVPGTNITYVGSVAGKAVLAVSGALIQQNLLVGNLSGATGAVYQTSGTLTVTNGGGDCFNVGNVAGAFGYYSISGGTLTANGIAVGGENNNGTGFSGTGGNGIMEVIGGIANDTGWLVMARGDAAETGVLNVSGGWLAYAGGGISACWGSNQVAIVNVTGGVVSNSAAVGINLNHSGLATNSGILNLNGGTVQAAGVSGPNARVNFNGGTLKAGATSGTFLAGLGSVNVYSNGATLNDNGFAIGINQPLLAPTGNGVNGIASFTPGAGYLAAPIVTVNRGGGDTTGVGATAIVQVDLSSGGATSGKVTNVMMTSPGANYTITPTFALSGGGATTPATITGQAPTANTSGGFTKTGAGTLSLGNASTYSGSTTISGGTLRLGDAVLHMTFDSVSGTTVTNAGSGGAAMNGTLTGTATIVAGGRFGKALNIPAGTSSAAYVLVNNSVVSFNATNSWSVGLWIQTSTAGGTYLYQGDGGWGSGNTTFYLNNGSGAGTKAGGVRYAQGWETGAANINDGAWHFLAMTDANGVRTMYVDGVVDSITVNAWTGTSVGGQLRIGGNATGEADGQVALGGMIDEVYIYNRALSQAEIQSLYAKNFSGTPVLPVATAVTMSSGTTLAIGGISQTIGSLAGSGSVILGDDAASLGNFTVGNGSNTTFSGIISDAAFMPVTKTGAGTLTLNGANTYRGTTTVSNGTLLVNGALGTNTLTVVSGTLGGGGNIGGAVTVRANGTLSPGTGMGRLTVSNSVTLQPGSFTQMEINRSPLTNDQLRATGMLTYGGTLTVTNLGAALQDGDTFQLFSATTYAGSFAATNLPALAGNLYWTNTLSANGRLAVVRAVSLVPTNIALAVSGTSLVLFWPADHTGWHLQVQTNWPAAGLGTNWFDVNGSAATNTILLPMDLGNGTVFYRLVYP